MFQDKNCLKRSKNPNNYCQDGGLDLQLVV